MDIITVESSEHRITPKSIEAFTEWLRFEERSDGTVEKYRRDISALSLYLNECPLSLESAAKWKRSLVAENLAPVTINSKLAALNTYCRFAGLSFKLKFLKIQRRLFRDDSRELKKEEYEKLVAAAENSGNIRLALLMETIAATGIRVSEVRYITLEAAKNGRTRISLKGKIREIFLPGKLCRKLTKYAKKQKIASGEIFITGNGTSLSRKQIWSEMKAICKKAGIAESKVFPHNLRHLFARVYYKVTRDIAKLADLLGHSSIETTRIYLTSTGREHRREMAKMGLVL